MNLPGPFSPLTSGLRSEHLNVQGELSYQSHDPNQGQMRDLGGASASPSRRTGGSPPSRPPQGMGPPGLPKICARVPARLRLIAKADSPVDLTVRLRAFVDFPIQGDMMFVQS